MPITKPGDPPPNPKYRWVLPIVLGIAVLGSLAPLAVSRYHTSVVQANQNDVVYALWEYAELQREFFQKNGRYAEFADLGGEWAKVQDLNSKTPTEFRGYRFKLFTSQADGAAGGAKDYLDKQGHMTGGYGLMAAPVHYGFTGRFTFFSSNASGTIYYYDMGVKTDVAARLIGEYYVPAGALPLEKTKPAP